MAEINPYASPTDIDYKLPETPVNWEEGKVFRDGPHMIIFDGAELPNRCFVTGEDTEQSAAVRQIWQPEWVSWLLLLGVFPYFFVSPFMHRVIEMELPVHSSVLEEHRRKYRFGLGLLAAGGLTMLVWNLWFGAGSNLLLLLAIGLGIFGFLLSSRAPVKLDIVAFEGNYLVIQNVHSRCLQAPEVHDIHDKEGS